MGAQGGAQGNMGAQDRMGAQGMGAQGGMHGGANYQAQAPRSGRMTDAAERRITECLNNAAAQHQGFDSCRR
jgi:hypothetical protein